MSFNINDRMKEAVKEVAVKEVNNKATNNITVAIADVTGTEINVLVAESVEQLKTFMIKEQYIDLKKLDQEQLRSLWQTKDIGEVMELSNAPYWEYADNQQEHEVTNQPDTNMLEDDWDIEFP